MGGFHGGHGHSGGGFHGGHSHGVGGFHSSGSHYSSSRYTGSGGHYSGGGSGGGRMDPVGGLILGLIGMPASLGLFVLLDYNYEMFFLFFACLILTITSIARLINDKVKVKKALQDDDSVDNVDNKVYEITQVDTKKNRVGTRVCRIIGYILVLLGGLFIILFHTNSTTARVISTQKAFDGEYYEEYVFEYTVDGNTYYGNGDDDLEYDYQSGEYVFDIEVGDEYPIYYYMVNPSSYSFSREPQAPLYIILIIGGTLLVVIGIVLRKKYLKSIEYVGDLNNDGKINEEDLILYNQKKSEEDLAKKAEAAKKYIECPFCSGKVKKDERNCPFCGGILIK